MAFGILDDHKLENVLGTALLSAKANQATADEARGLKRGTGKHSHIVLIPQPSDDPRDPLNWPRWKKEACFWTVMLAASLSDGILGIASPAYVQLSQQFHVSVDEVASSFSGSYLGLAAFTLVQNPFAIKYGHRIVYLASTLLVFISCIWSAVSPDLRSLQASRILQGLGAATPQCLVAVTIEHLFLIVIIGSYVIQDLSWNLDFWFTSIVCGLCFIGVFFFVPETTYRRDRVMTTQRKDITWKCNVGDSESTPRVPGTSHVEIHNIDRCHREEVSPLRPPTYFSQLKIFNGVFSDESIWKIFLRPFPFILSPMTLFALICYCIPTFFFRLIVQCSSTIFTIEYDFNTTQIGLLNVTGIISVVLAMLITGPLNDWVIIQMSRRNHGIYEPEYRLVFTHSMIISVFAYVGWAVGNAHHMPWIGAIACMTMLSVGVLISWTPPLAYLIDTHGAHAVHIIVLATFAKNMLSYGASFFANDAVLAHGITAFLVVLAACQAGCWLVAVAMYVFGKRVRSFVARHPRLFCRGLQSEGDSPESQSEK